MHSTMTHPAAVSRSLILHFALINRLTVPKSSCYWLFAPYIVLLALGLMASSPVGAQAISASAVQQIQALMDEKASRTPVQQKISSRLLYTAKMQRHASIAAGVDTLDVNVGINDAGRAIVDIRATVDDALINAIVNTGAEILEVSPDYHSIRAQVSLDQLESIASLAAVRFIRADPQARHNRAVSEVDKQAHSPFPTFSDWQAPGGFRRNAEPELIQRFSSAQTHSVLSSVSHIPSPITNVILNGYAGTGTANAEGVITHNVYSARGTFNVDGTGIRVGVLSDAVDSLATSQATGDLPATCSSLAPPATEHCINVVPGQAGSGGDEGTAMLEIIHDMAPGAQLYFATAFNSITSFATNINLLRTTYGCDIIVDDVGYYVESPFQDGQIGTSATNGGIVTEAVNDVVADGALYFSSAANSGNLNDGTASTWEGDFVNGGTLALIAGGNVHDFDATASVSQYNAITVSNSGSPITLNWSDPLGASGNDYDLYVLNNSGTAIADASTDFQLGFQDPFEEVDSNNIQGRRVVILQNTGAANRFLHLTTNRGRLTFTTRGETHGHNAASGAYGVAATPAYAPFSFPSGLTFFNGPYLDLFDTTHKVETFSSDGPRQIFFNADGSAITPGNFSSTGGSVLQQPLITAADGVEVTGVGDFGSPFFGTSAAAPSAAAIAVLLKSANPALTPAQIKTALTSTAIDIETAGVDQDSGYGIIMAYAALQAAGLTGKAFLEFNGATTTESIGNGDSLIDPGETANLTLNLKNTGLLNATGITTTLTTATSGVTVSQGTSAYATLTTSGGLGANSTAFTFKVTGSPEQTDLLIDFSLTINYTGGWSSTQVINFTVQTGRQPITTVLDGTVPATNNSFPTTATGTQVNRVARDTVASSCGTAKGYPGTSSASSPRFDTYTLTNITGADACVTVTLTPDKTSTGFLEVVAYAGSFNSASISTNYLADAGTSPALGYPLVFAFDVAAGATVVLVVNEAPNPSAVNTPYTLQVSGLGRVDLVFRDNFE